MLLKPVSILCCSSSEMLTKCCNVYNNYITTFVQLHMYSLSEVCNFVQYLRVICVCYMYMT